MSGFIGLFATELQISISIECEDVKTALTAYMLFTIRSCSAGKCVGDYPLRFQSVTRGARLRMLNLTLAHIIRLGLSLPIPNERTEQTAVICDLNLQSSVWRSKVAILVCWAFSELFFDVNHTLVFNIHVQ